MSKNCVYLVEIEGETFDVTASLSEHPLLLTVDPEKVCVTRFVSDAVLTHEEVVTLVKGE